MRDAKVWRFCSAAGVAMLLSAPLLFHHQAATATASEGPAPAVGQSVTTTLGDQSDLALTVYNSNLSLVRDVRQLNLPAGESVLRFMDIAASINPATVHFRSLTDPAK